MACESRLCALRDSSVGSVDHGFPSPEANGLLSYTMRQRNAPASSQARGNQMLKHVNNILIGND